MSAGVAADLLTLAGVLVGLFALAMVVFAKLEDRRRARLVAARRAAQREAIGQWWASQPDNGTWGVGHVRVVRPDVFDQERYR